MKNRSLNHRLKVNRRRLLEGYANVTKAQTMNLLCSILSFTWIVWEVTLSLSLSLSTLDNSLLTLLYSLAHNRRAM